MKTTFLMPRRRAVAGILALVMSGTALGYGCPPVIDPIWQAAVQAAQQAINAAIKSSGNLISEQRAQGSKQIQSALGSLARQIKASADQQANTTIKSQQASADYASLVSDRGMIFRTAMQYDAVSGQGADPCGDVRRNLTVSAALAEAQGDLPARILREVDAAPGRLVTNSSAVVADRVSMSRGKYCTAQEQAQGLCSSVGAQAGLDTDSANFFTSAAAGSEQSKAKNALLNHIYGVPAQLPPEIVQGTPSATAFFEAKRASDAFTSVSLTSAKAVQALTESRDGMPSALDAVREKVNVYSGGAGFENWVKRVSAQSEHGLLIDYAKMRAFELWMANLEYQSMERMEANLAALLLAREDAARRSSQNDLRIQGAAARQRVVNQ